MNAPQPANLFGTIELAPRDPILGVTEAYNADTESRTRSTSASASTATTTGKVPLLECVQARRARAGRKGAAASPTCRSTAFRRTTRRCRRCCSAPTARSSQGGRAVTVQALGGTGALKVGADFLRRFAPGAQVWISDPSWENHRALFEGAGFTVDTYPYYDAATHGLDFAGMIASLERLPPGAIVVLHACCHNPTGVDPTPAQWDEDHRDRASARPRAVPRHRLPGLRRRHRRGRRRGAPVRGDTGSAPRGELVLQVVLALRRARRRADRRGCEQGRGRARAVAGEAAGARQLLEPAHPSAARSWRRC